MPMTRRELIKANAAAAAAAAIGMTLPAAAANLVLNDGDASLKWSEAPCRFCGVGCGVVVATRDNRVVATRGDVEHEVNRGLNCVEGYVLPAIMCRQVRAATPLLRKRT